jgi:hypothetical protein
LGRFEENVCKILSFLYENFRAAVAMLFTTLLAIAGVYVGLLVTGTEFNITSRMGMKMIVGIVTEVAILYYSEYQTLPPDSHRYVQLARIIPHTLALQPHSGRRFSAVTGRIDPPNQTCEGIRQQNDVRANQTTAIQGPDILRELKHLFRLHRRPRRPTAQVQTLQERLVCIVKLFCRDVKDLRLGFNDAAWSDVKSKQL